MIVPRYGSITKNFLCQDNHGFKLLLKKFILISRDPPVLNENTASVSLILFD